MQTSLADMAYEVIVRSWRPMNTEQLRGAIREMYAATVKDDELLAALAGDERFTVDTSGRYGLDEFHWISDPAFGFSYLDPGAIA